MNSKLALVVAVILGIFSTVAVKFHIDSVEKSTQNQFQTVNVLVAKTNLQPGKPVRPSDVDIRPLPFKFFDSVNMLTDSNSDQVINKPIYYEVKKGGILLYPYFNAREGVDNSISTLRPMAANLKPIERAVTVKVDSITGVANLLKPGEYVDLYWTGTVEGYEANSLGLKIPQGQNSLKISYLILCDIQVIALDSKTDLSPEYSRNRMLNGGGSYSMVTLRCRTYEEAKLLIHAQSSGRITMSKKGEDRMVVDDDVAMDVPKMFETSKRVNSMRKRQEEVK